MGRSYPALDIDGAGYELLAASLDDFAPTAVEERGQILRVFFGTAAHRDAARAALGPDVPSTAIEVPDEDWARRSQADLHPITVGRITVAPTPGADLAGGGPGSPIHLVIPPSMGFGTGHHATTRLCLLALQAIDVAGKTVLDVGTGSGILAIAAARLGAASATGIDLDEDAVRAARESLALNPQAAHVEFEIADLTTISTRPADVVVANLTAWLLERSASTLTAAVRADGVLIASGFHTDERGSVTRAFPQADVIWQEAEQAWAAVAMKKL